MKLAIERTVIYQSVEGIQLKILLSTCTVLTVGRYEHTYLPAAREWFIAATDRQPEEVIKEVKDKATEMTPELRWLFWLVDKAYGWALVVASIREVRECKENKWRKVSIPEEWLNLNSYMENMPDDLSQELMVQSRVCNPQLFQLNEDQKKLGVLSVS